MSYTLCKVRVGLFDERERWKVGRRWGHQNVDIYDILDRSLKLLPIHNGQVYNSVFPAVWTALFMIRMYVHSLAGSPRPVAVSSLNRSSHSVGGSFDGVV